MDFSKKNKPRVTYTIDADIVRQLDEFCAKNNVPKSRVIERVLEDFFNKK